MSVADPQLGRRMAGDRGDNIRSGGLFAKSVDPVGGGSGAKRGRYRERIATVVGTSRSYYNPTHQIAQSIASALNPDVVLAQMPTMTSVHGGGSPLVVVRAEILGESCMAVRVRIYSWVGWLPKAWCERRAGNVLAINADRLRRKPGLARAIRMHADLRRRLSRK